MNLKKYPESEKDSRVGEGGQSPTQCPPSDFAALLYSL